MKVENYRFVFQQCEVCGAAFPVVYQYKEGKIEPFGDFCVHVADGASFIPIEEEPTFEEWYEEQTISRKQLGIPFISNDSEDVRITPVKMIPSPYVMDVLTNIDEVCADYGLYGKIVNYQNKNSVLGSGYYIVICTHEIEDDIKPDKIAARIIRNSDILYIQEYAVNLTPENVLVVLEEAIEHCQDVEFLSKLYAEYSTDLPECIRHSEAAGLRHWHEGRNNVDAADKFRLLCEKGFRSFFKHEKSHFGREKSAFFRSGKFDENAGVIKQQKDFANRNSPIVDLDVLMQRENDIAKLVIGKRNLERFTNYIKNAYPEVIFAVSELQVVDSGLIDATRNLPDDHPLMKQRPVTDEEFAQVIEQRFATEGFDCVKDIKPAKIENHTIYYKKIDEPQIIAAYNDIYLTFADHDPLQDVKARGQIAMIDININNIHRFVALAKSKGLCFHFDHRGQFAKPSFDDIHVIYAIRDQGIIEEIINEMVYDVISNSHYYDIVCRKA